MKNSFIRFMEYAHAKGYAEKVVGDDSYTKTRDPHSAMIKLKSARNDKLQIYEDNVGAYEVDE